MICLDSRGGIHSSATDGDARFPEFSDYEREMKNPQGEERSTKEGRNEHHTKSVSCTVGCGGEGENRVNIRFTISARRGTFKSVRSVEGFVGKVRTE